MMAYMWNGKIASAEIQQRGGKMGTTKEMWGGGYSVRRIRQKRRLPMSVVAVEIW